MNTILINYETTCAYIEEQPEESRKQFFQYFIMQAVILEIELARERDTPKFTQVDLNFVVKLAERLLDKRDTTIGMLEGRWREFSMIPEDD